MRVLFICTQSPWPADGGTPLRTQAWIRTAAQSCDIGLVALVRSEAEAAMAGKAREVCGYLKVVRDPLSAMKRRALRPVAIGSLAPYFYTELDSAAMWQGVRDAMSEFAPDIVQAEWIGSARYLDVARAAGIPRVFSAHNVEHRILARTPGRTASVLGAPFVYAMARRERRVAADAAVVAVVSEEDGAWFRPLARRTVVVPNGVMADTYSYTPPSARSGPVGFIATLAYPPNAAAARLLATGIYPRLASLRPDVRCLIAGRSPGRRVRALAREGVTIDGDVADMGKHWATLRVLVSPLAWGGGSRIKLLEAAAVGVPIVATPVSAEGLAFVGGRDYLAGKTVEELAQATLTLLNDPGYADKLAAQALETLRAHHDWRGFGGAILDMYRAVLADDRQPTIEARVP